MKKILLKLNVFLIIFILFFAGTVLIGRSVNKHQKDDISTVQCTTDSLLTTEDFASSPSEEDIADELTTQSTTENTTFSVSEDLTESTDYSDTSSEDDTTLSSTTQGQMPEEMELALIQSGYDSSTLDNINCQQLVLVASNGSNASIYLFTKNSDGVWINAGLNTYGYVGSNGVSAQSYEGSRMTPSGLFSIGDAFYIEETPDTNLLTFEITENTYWVDDPESVYYNQKVELEGDPEWTSAEHMISYYNAYYYGFVINFNMNPVISGKGSAIFFHVGESPTAGCVAVSQSMILQYLRELDINKNPYILII